MDCTNIEERGERERWMEEHKSKVDFMVGSKRCSAIFAVADGGGDG